MRKNNANVGEGNTSPSSSKPTDVSPWGKSSPIGDGSSLSPKPSTPTSSSAAGFWANSSIRSGSKPVPASEEPSINLINNVVPQSGAQVNSGSTFTSLKSRPKPLKSSINSEKEKSSKVKSSRHIQSSFTVDELISLFSIDLLPNEDFLNDNEALIISESILQPVNSEEFTEVESKILGSQNLNSESFNRPRHQSHLSGGRQGIDRQQSRNSRGGRVGANTRFSKYGNNENYNTSRTANHSSKPSFDLPPEGLPELKPWNPNSGAADSFADDSLQSTRPTDPTNKRDSTNRFSTSTSSWRDQNNLETFGKTEIDNSKTSWNISQSNIFEEKKNKNEISTFSEFFDALDAQQPKSSQLQNQSFQKSQPPQSQNQNVSEQLLQNHINLLQQIQSSMNGLIQQKFTSQEFLPPQWVYNDNAGVLQGPFHAAQMHEWFRLGYLPDDLLTRRTDQPSFVPLIDLVVAYGREQPFIISAIQAEQTHKRIQLKLEEQFELQKQQQLLLLQQRLQQQQNLIKSDPLGLLWFNKVTQQSLSTPDQQSGFKQHQQATIPSTKPASKGGLEFNPDGSSHPAFIDTPKEHAEEEYSEEKISEKVAKSPVKSIETKKASVSQSPINTKEKPTALELNNEHDKLSAVSSQPASSPAPVSPWNIGSTEEFKKSKLSLQEIQEEEKRALEKKKTEQLSNKPLASPSSVLVNQSSISSIDSNPEIHHSKESSGSVWGAKSNTSTTVDSGSTGKGLADILKEEKKKKKIDNTSEIKSKSTIAAQLLAAHGHSESQKQVNLRTEVTETETKSGWTTISSHRKSITEKQSNVSTPSNASVLGLLAGSNAQATPHASSALSSRKTSSVNNEIQNTLGDNYVSNQQKTKQAVSSFSDWIYSSLKEFSKQQQSGANFEEFVTLLLSLSADDVDTIKMICEDTLGAFVSIDTNKFSVEFCNKKKSAINNDEELISQVVNQVKSLHQHQKDGGWQSVGDKKHPSNSSGMYTNNGSSSVLGSLAGYVSGVKEEITPKKNESSNRFTVVAGKKKKGKK